MILAVSRPWIGTSTQNPYPSKPKLVFPSSAVHSVRASPMGSAPIHSPFPPALLTLARWKNLPSSPADLTPTPPPCRIPQALLGFTQPSETGSLGTRSLLPTLKRSFLCREMAPVTRYNPSTSVLLKPRRGSKGLKASAWSPGRPRDSFNLFLE